MLKVIELSKILPVFQFAQLGGRVDRGLAEKGLVSGRLKPFKLEVQEWLCGQSGLLDERGRKRIARNEHLPEPTIFVGIGPVAVRQPRVNDRLPYDERELCSSISCHRSCARPNRGKS